MCINHFNKIVQVMSKDIVFVTGNKNKLEEIIEITGKNFPLKIISRDIDLTEIQGDIEEICYAKCKEAAKIVQGPVLVDDTSLCFNALGGLPGPYIKWFLQNIGSHGLYKLLDGWTDKSALAICTIAYCQNGGECEPVLFQGKISGKIVEPRGNLEFGWDPCFLPDNCDKTFGEMNRYEKNQISQRRIAIEKLKSYFESSFNTSV